MRVNYRNILPANKIDFKLFKLKDDSALKLEFKYNSFAYEISYGDEQLGWYKTHNQDLMILEFLETLAEYNGGDQVGVKARLNNMIEVKSPIITQQYPTAYKSNMLKYLLGLEDNMIKSVCIEQNLTYQQLADILGLSESSLRSAASTNKVSKQVEKSIEMYLKIVHLEKELDKANEIKATLKSWLS